MPTPLRTVLIALVGAVCIAVGAQVSVPMVPVPMTLQTLAVVAVGLVGGAGAGAGAALGYLALVLLGLPVLSEGSAHGGLSFFAEPTAGYVVGFVPGAALAGWLGKRGEGLAAQVGWGTAGGLVGHAVVLVLGTAVLARVIGLSDALVHGCLPFLPGAVVKSLVPAMFVVAGRMRIERERRRAP